MYECHGGRHPYIATQQAPPSETRCPEVNLTFERQCEQPAGHDGWHGFMWDWNDREQGANWWPGRNDRGGAEMDRNEREAREYEHEARDARKHGNDRRATDMQAHADHIRGEVKRGTPIFRKC
jgi:hypothetical protein